MFQKGEHFEVVPSELQKLLNKDKKGNVFFRYIVKILQTGLL